jgi:Protein of unknown function (DUF1579)
MSLTKWLLPIAGVALLSVSAAAAQEMPAPPTPGPEHDVLKMDVGTWDAVIEITPGPGMPPMTSKGVEVNEMSCGGLCLISNFDGDLMPGMKFQGHGVSTWDPKQQKYVGAWADSMSPGITVSESTYDPATKKATGWMEGVDMNGNKSKSKAVVEYQDADHRTMTMFMTMPDGQEMQTMKISYTRQK